MKIVLTLSLQHRTTILFSPTPKRQNQIAVSREMTNAFGPDALYLASSTPVTGDNAAYYVQQVNDARLVRKKQQY